MSEWLREFMRGALGDFFDLPAPGQVGQLVVRMLMAGVLGGILGYQRESQGKAAGLKTHVIVALAAAFFVANAQQAGLSNADISRVIQGIAAGVGFLGAGTILKQSEQGQVIGLTTAANLYLTTAIGVAAGLGRETSAILGTLMAYLVFAVLGPIQDWMERRDTDRDAMPTETDSSRQPTSAQSTTDPALMISASEPTPDSRPGPGLGSAPGSMSEATSSAPQTNQGQSSRASRRAERKRRRG